MFMTALPSVQVQTDTSRHTNELIVLILTIHQNEVFQRAYLNNFYVCAFVIDMAVQNFVGDAFRGATWVALHNGGGVGW